MKRHGALLLALASGGVLVGALVGGIRGATLGPQYIVAAIAKGTVLGPLLALSVGGLEQIVLRRLWRRLTFVWAILARTALYVPIVIAVFVVVSVAFTPWVPWQLQRPMILPSLVITITCVVIGSAFLAITRLLGFRVLRELVSGRYRRPFEEDRIFLFLDLIGSTTIAERIGSVRYHSFLSSVIADLEEPVFDHDGDVYQYVGDEVVVTWPVTDSRNNGHCVSCYFAILEMFDRLAPRYETEFGAVPRFRAGIHCGRVVAGEIGDQRKQIVFVGDVVNTASRMETEAKNRHLNAVVSGALLSQIKLPAGIKVHSIGTVRPKGKEAEVELFGVGRC